MFEYLTFPLRIEIIEGGVEGSRGKSSGMLMTRKREKREACLIVREGPRKDGDSEKLSIPATTLNATSEAIDMTQD